MSAAHVDDCADELESILDAERCGCGYAECPVCDISDAIASPQGAEQRQEGWGPSHKQPWHAQEDAVSVESPCATCGGRCFTDDRCGRCGAHPEPAATQGDELAGWLDDKATREPSSAEAYMLREAAKAIRLSSPPGVQAAQVSDADVLLAGMGLDPERFRTEAGVINHLRVKAAIRYPGDYSGYYLPTAAQHPSSAAHGGEDAK